VSELWDTSLNQAKKKKLHQPQKMQFHHLFVILVIFALNTFLLEATIVKPGIDGDISIFKGQSIGLITNPTGVAFNFTSTIDLLFAEQVNFKLVSLFSPEHGLRGDMPPGQHTDSYIDPITGLPVFSLYGKNLAPTPEQLSNVTMLVFDLQDVGVRCFTYMSTMAKSLAVAAKANIPFVVIDRVNPIGATTSRVKGPVLDLDFVSFIGIWSIPLQHGMTMGELALLFNEEMEIYHKKLVILKIQGDYSDRLPLNSYSQTAWLPPSPNMPSITTAFLYPGLVLFEAFRNVSLGRGTATPFQILGAPYINNYKLIHYLYNDLLPNNPELKKYLAGVTIIPAFWIPSTDVHQGVQCSGIRILVIDESQLDPIGLTITLMRAFLDLYPIAQLDMRKSDLNIRMGYDAFTEFTNNVPLSTIVAKWESKLNLFKQRRAKYILY
jgi:uncharacterized protein YbbC (DUF1343 family)